MRHEHVMSAVLLIMPLTWCASVTAMDVATPPPGSAVEGKPNFVVILCDDLGYGDLACFGHPTIKTPNLDKLASEGIRLTACYAAAPVCSSSRAGLLTGRTPNRLGVYDWIPPGHPMHLRRQEVTLASLLKKAGYATCQVGKWHCNGLFNSKEQPQPGDHGFDHWFATQNNASPSHQNPTNFVRNGSAVGPLKGYSCQIVADEAIRWLQVRKAAAPFLLFVCFHEPHEPVASPPEMVADYPGATKRGEAMYYANVTNIDAAVGRIVKTLDDLKLAENTLVFFTSDNGPETLSRYPNAWRSHGSPGPLRGMKLHIYEGGIRVPGILRWTGRVKPGRISDTPVCGLDLLPTFSELAGVEPPRDRALDGASFVPLLDGRAVERATPLFWHYYRALTPPRVAMRDGDWKIVAHWDGPFMQDKVESVGRGVNRRSQEVVKTAKLTKFELYNVHEDISEKLNVAEGEPAVLGRLKAKLLAKYADVQEEGPVWDTDEYWSKRGEPQKPQTPNKPEK